MTTLCYCKHTIRSLQTKTPRSFADWRGVFVGIPQKCWRLMQYHRAVMLGALPYAFYFTTNAHVVYTWIPTSIHSFNASYVIEARVLTSSGAP